MVSFCLKMLSKVPHLRNTNCWVLMHWAGFALDSSLCRHFKHIKCFFLSHKSLLICVCRLTMQKHADEPSLKNEIAFHLAKPTISGSNLRFRSVPYHHECIHLERRSFIYTYIILFFNLIERVQTMSRRFKSTAHKYIGNLKWMKCSENELSYESETNFSVPYFFWSIAQSLHSFEWS